MKCGKLCAVLAFGAAWVASVCNAGQVIGEIYSSSPSFSAPYIQFGVEEKWKVEDVRAALEVLPPVKDLSVSHQYSWGVDEDGKSDAFRIDGDFEPGKSYTLLFKFKEDGREREISRRVALKERDCAVKAMLPGRYLAPAGDLLYPVNSVGATGVTVKVWSVLPANIAQFCAREAGIYNNYYGRAYPEELAEEGKEIYIPIKDAPRNKEVRTDVSLKNLVSGNGVYLVRLSCEDAYSNDERLICIGDIGMGAAVDAASVRVWTVSLAKGLPIGNLKVKAFAANNQLLGESVADADGSATINIPKGKAPFVLTAETGDGKDRSFLPLTDKTETTEPNKAKMGFVGENNAEAYIYTDRALYRPGDRLFLQAILRDAQAKAPKQMPVEIAIHKGVRNLLQTQLVSSASGTISLPEGVEIPDNSRAGRWTVTARTPGDAGYLLGETDFFVESFVPRQIKVAVKGLKDEYVYGDEVKFAVHADWLFGKPAENLSAEALITLADAPFEPIGWKGWNFADKERKLPSTPIRMDSVITDEGGNAEFTLKLPRNISPASAVKATFAGIVAEPGGRTVTGRATRILHAYPYYIGLKTKDFQGKAGATNVIHAVTVNTDGTMKRDPSKAKATLSTVKRYWGCRRNDNGSWSWVDERQMEPIRNWELTLEGDTAIPVSVNTPGTYLLEIAAGEGVRNTIQFDIFAQRSGGWEFDDEDFEPSSNLSDPGKVELTLDKKRYEPGETARLAIKAPFAGTAQLTISQNKIINQYTFPLAASGRELPIQVKKEWFPNVNLSIRLININTNDIGWAARRASGAAVISVGKPESEIDVSLRAENQIIAGGSTVDAEIDAAGAEFVTVLVADQSIHMLTDAQPPDPVAWFAQSRYGDEKFYDVYSMIMPVALPAARRNIGGGDDDELMNRISPVRSRRFKPLALWKADLPVKGGKAKVSFNLPEFAGEVRVCAVAWSATATGSASTQLHVRPKLVSLPDAPRFLAGGDKGDMTLSLHNTTQEDGVAAYEISCDGLLDKTPLQKGVVPLVKGASKVLRFPIAAQEMGHGTGNIHVRVEGLGENHSHVMEMPVRPAVPMRTDVEHATLKAGEERTFLLPTGVIESAARQKVEVNGSQWSQCIPALEYVIAYPYGCCEQTVSSVFPLIASGGFLASFAAANASLQDEAHVKVRNAIDRLVSMNRDEHGYVMWPNLQWDKTEIPLSLYTCWFLAEAERGDWKVPAEIRKDNIRFLERLAENSSVSPDFRAYACHVLAAYGCAYQQIALRLLDAQKSLSMEGKCHLSAALSLGGRKDLGRAILLPIQAPDGIRSAALAIIAWEELDSPERDTRVQTLVSQLLSMRKGIAHWGNTQNNSLALLAIASAAQRAKPVKGEFALTAKNSSGDIICATNKPCTFRADNTAFTVTNAGPGEVSLIRKTQAFPLLASVEPHENGLHLQRKWWNMDSRQADLNNLKVGDRIDVEIVISATNEENRKDVVVEEMLPACFEVEKDPNEDNKPWFQERQFRDDRILWFGNIPGKEAVVWYTVRVVSAGEFVLPPSMAERMYEPEITCHTGVGRITVKK